MYKQKVEVGSNDINALYELRVSSLFKIMQDVIMHHTEVLNIGVKVTNEENVAWVILRMHVEIKKTPKYQQELTFFTYPNETRGFLYPRQIQVYDEKGDLNINISSLWTLINKKDRKPVTNSRIENSIKGENHENELPLPGKVKIEEAPLIYERKIQYSDVDLNGHLNNTKYIEIFENIHNTEFYKTHKIKSIDLNYLKEIKEGQTIKISANRRDNEEFVRFDVDDELCFIALIKY